MKSLILKSMAVIALTIIVVVIGVGCKHTAQGMGKDMENAGEKIQEKSR